jgi:signal recognition particle subunit SRP54
MLERLREGLQNAIRKILGATIVDEQAVKEFVRDVQRALLQADVNVKLVFELTKRIEERALKEKIPAGLPRKDHIIKILYEELSSLLGEEQGLNLPYSKQNVILLIGVQGSGKTTTAAKLARYLQKRGYKVGVVCADTFRPGAYTQLKMLCEKVDIEVYGDEKEKDAIRIAREGVKKFKEDGKNVIIVDTAGRHKEEKGLLEEMKMISEAIKPDLTLLVIDAAMGQLCYSMAQAFHNFTKVGGIIITKLDGSAKGGGALAATAATGAKILFIGNGERLDDLDTFSPTRFVGRLLGLGDIKALLERAKELELETDKERMKRIVSGKLTINDFYYQIEQVKKLGSLRKILDLIPGFSTSIPSESIEDMEDKLEVWKSIIQSMTRKERENPEIINASRIRRIARGSGRSEKDVREMLIRFKQTKALMRQSKGRAFRQLMRRIAPYEARA